MKLKLTQSMMIWLAILLVAPFVQAQDARDIMLKVDKISRESSKSTLQKMKLMTCAYGKKGPKTVCTKSPRVKVIESAQQDAGENGKDSQSVSFILEPIGEKGMGMLSYEFDDPDKDTINWLYLSAMGKVKKIISGESEDDEGSSFFGSEFLLEDLENQEIDDYTYRLLKQGTYQKRPVWVIEAIPTPKRLRKSRYGKSIIWVDQERYFVLMSQMFDKRLKPYKQIAMNQVELIDNVWTARNVMVKNLQSRRMSAMILDAVSFNVEIPEQFLAQRALVDFAYRERELARLRQHLQGKEGL